MMKVKNFLSKMFGKLTVVVDDNGNSWFIAREICEKLNHDMSHLSKYILPEDAKRVAISSLPFELALNASSNSSGRGGSRTLYLVSEAGMYDLILASRKPETKEFQRWITHEVIPSIRKYGMYAEGMEELAETEKQTVSNEALEHIAYLQKRRHEIRAQLLASEEKRKELKSQLKTARSDFEILLTDIAEVEERLIKEQQKYDAEFERKLYVKEKQPESRQMTIFVDEQGFICNIQK